MVCVGINSQGFLQSTGQPIDTCEAYVLVSKSDYDFWFDYVSVSPADAGSAISFGIGIVFVIGFLSTYPLKVALNVVRKL